MGRRPNAFTKKTTKKSNLFSNPEIDKIVIRKQVPTAVVASTALKHAMTTIHHDQPILLKNTTYTRKRKNIAWDIESKKDILQLQKKEETLLSSIEEFSYDELRTLLIQKKLIKPTSSAPDAILRQIARGIV